MFNLGGLNDLARGLGVDLGFLHEVLDDFETAPDTLVRELTLWRADQSKRPREVISLRSRWRLVQERIYSKLLLPHFRPSKCCHGGVRGRSPATNARMHLGNAFAFVADIANFFPSINCKRVGKFFMGKACAYEVANALTRLCTHDYHLALGLVTSPVIANEIMQPVDEDIERFCRKYRLAYSRFIDDIAISGKYDLRECRAEEAIGQILTKHHFKIAKNKSAYGRLDVAPVRERVGECWQQLAITGIRLKGDHLDPSPKYIGELERIIADHASLAADGPFDGPLHMQSEVFGKVYYACSLNSGRRRTLLGRMKEVDWCKVLQHAVDRDIARYRNRLTPRGESRPDCSEPLALAAGAKFCEEYYETHAYDPSIAPFDVPAPSEAMAG